MRRLALLLFATMLASLALVTTGASPASAECPQGDGTVPQTASRAFRVGVGEVVVYIDDRDFIDYDDDGKAGGLWIYAESNGVSGLQRGGSGFQFAVFEDLTGLDASIPVIQPIVLPTEHTLFPNGFGGGSLEETAGSHDDCTSKYEGPKDAIIF